MMTESEKERSEARQQARAAFPCGLIQPENAFKCSVDALLLADFSVLRAPVIRKNTLAQQPAVKVWRALDLGTGCGVVALSFLLHLERLGKNTTPHVLEITGVDCTPEMVQAARANATQLGFADCFHVYEADIRQPECASPPQWQSPNSYMLIFSNPPYSSQQGSRLPMQTLRQRALMDDGALALFTATAYQLLRPRGYFTCIVHAQRCADMIHLLQDQHFSLSRLKMVHPHSEKKARFALLEARKGANAQLVVEKPLFLQH